MKLDAHQHFWCHAADAADYGWMGETEAPLRRDFGPDDLAPQLAAAGYGGTVAVQAREVPAETGALLALARRHAFVKGVVGWLDLCADDAEAEIERAAADPLLRGFRMAIHDRPDPGFAASAAHVRGVARLARHGLAYDLLLRPEHLGAALALVDACPGVRFVVDHLAKPDLGAPDASAWRDGLAALALRPNAWCKLSGLGTLPGAAERGTAAALPRLDAALEAFGADRCMIGSDWPVCTLAADYCATMGVVERWCGPLSADERSAILGRSCAAFYGLPAG